MVRHPLQICSVGVGNGLAPISLLSPSVYWVHISGVWQLPRQLADHIDSSFNVLIDRGQGVKFMCPMALVYIKERFDSGGNRKRSLPDPPTSGLAGPQSNAPSQPHDEATERTRRD